MSMPPRHFPIYLLLIFFKTSYYKMLLFLGVVRLNLFCLLNTLFKYLQCLKAL